MKTTKSFGLVMALALPLLSTYAQSPAASEQTQTAAANLSPAAAEVVRLATSGISDDVILSYIKNSQAQFSLSADNLLYLKDIGLSAEVTSAMLNHDATSRTQPEQSAPVAPDQALATAPTASAAAATPTYVSSPPPDVAYFYDELAPYGTWLQLEGYGWCWQPNVVVTTPGWRPYCHGGYWLYTDAGWYWQSTYSWGWAPFHYGRWHLDRQCGWVWIPDRVWGPAWVTWRVAGDTCGWAPLPPRAEFDPRLGWRFNGFAVGATFDFGLGLDAFTFVAFGDFCSRNLAPRCLPRTRVSPLFRQASVITDFAVVNGAIVHRGIPLARMTAAVHAPIPRATVRDLPPGSARPAAGPGSVVYRPHLQAPPRSGNMVAQKIDPQHPVIHYAPVAPGRTERPSAFSRDVSGPATSSRRPAVESPKVSPWSGGAKSTPSPQSQSAPRTSRTAPTASSAPASSRAPDDWKQGSRSMPGYRSDTGLPALSSRRSSQSEPASGPKESAAPHFYQPKSGQQAAEVRSLPPSDSGSSSSSSRTSSSSSSRQTGPASRPSGSDSPPKKDK